MEIFENLKTNIKRNKLAISWFFIYSTSLIALLAPYNVDQNTYETLFNLKLRVKDETKAPMNNLINSSYLVFGLLFLIFIFQAQGGKMDCPEEEDKGLVPDKAPYILGSTTIQKELKPESRLPVRLTFFLYFLIGTLSLINVSILGTNRKEIESEDSDLFFGTPGGVAQVLLNVTLWLLILYYFVKRGIFSEFISVVSFVIGVFKLCCARGKPRGSGGAQGLPSY
jgi:hypothetical protein